MDSMFAPSAGLDSQCHMWGRVVPGGAQPFQFGLRPASAAEWGRQATSARRYDR
jgi:hypothetical protein